MKYNTKVFSEFAKLLSCAHVGLLDYAALTETVKHPQHAA